MRQFVTLGAAAGKEAVLAHVEVETFQTAIPDEMHNNSVSVNCSSAARFSRIFRQNTWQSGSTLRQWRGKRYDGTSNRTGPLQSKKLKIELKDNAKK